MKRTVAFVISLTMFVTTFHSAAIKPLSEPAAEGTVSEFHLEGSYGSYLNQHKTAKIILGEQSYPAASFSEGENVEILSEHKGKSNVLRTNENSKVSYEVEVEEDGFYNLALSLCPEAGKGTTIERDILIDGELPFSQAASVTFDRIYEDDRENSKLTDAAGNELRPNKKQIMAWRTDSVREGGRLYADPLNFYLTTGKHTVTLASVREPLIIENLILYGEAQPLSYEEYIKQHPFENGNKLVDKYQAEVTSSHSDPMIQPVFDRSSSASEPSGIKEIKLNILGGSRWKVLGQWAEWKLVAPRAGYYKIAFRSRQNILNGLFVSRRLTIDGEIPFKEAEAIRFDYSGNWQITVPGEDSEMYVYLKEGENTLRLEAVIGDMQPILETVENSVRILNNDFRQILMITGNIPDTYRDYEFDKEIPEVLKDFAVQARALETAVERLVVLNGKRGENTATLERIIRQLKEMVKNPETIAKRFDSFKGNLGALGTWLLTAREQPLELDYIILSEPDYRLPKAENGFFKNLFYELQIFFISFFTDYNNIGGSEQDEMITVWTTAGREQAQVLRQLVDRNFIEESGIGVDLQVVAAGSFLPAVLAGKGPDIALNNGSADNINYALREAVASLDSYPDYEKVISRFHKSALEPLKFGGKTYGLPETQTFPMLFYRKDIFEEMGLTVPNTWDELYDLLREVQKNNLEFGISSLMNSYGILLYQLGGEFYSENATKSLLDSETSVNAFKMWTEFYSHYKSPVEFDFANRFRTGQMPVAIADYTQYNQLSVFAPEIKGLWGFVPMIGFEKDGKIDRTVPSGVTATIMVGKSENKDNAWKFMEWWTRAEVQAEYGKELESIMGAAARYNSANMETMSMMPWRADELASLKSQLQFARGIPEVPGGYYTSRYIDFAFRKIVLQGEDVRETLQDYAKTINEEIKYKREEFKLPLE